VVFDDDDDDDDDDDLERAINMSKDKEDKEDNRMITKSIEVDGENRTISGGQEDLMAPIRALLSAQAAKEKAALERSEEMATSRKLTAQGKFDALGVGADGKSRVHRDVFGGVNAAGR
jgi:hypothetical protein